MTQPDGLLLRKPNLVDRTASLFAELNADSSLQRAFVASPETLVGGRSYHGASATQLRSSVAPFLFSILADERIQRWLKANSISAAHSVQQRLRALAHVFIEYGGLRFKNEADII